MLNILKRRNRPTEPPGQVNGHDLADGPLPPWTNQPQVRETRVFVGKRGGKDKLPARILTLAGLIITAALLGSAFVGYEAQRLFAAANNHDPNTVATTADQARAVIIAALPDLGWVGMALVALVAALRGQSSLRARVGVIVFFGLSLGAQVLYAPRTVEGILVAVVAPLTMAWMLETWIVEVRRWAAARRNLDITETPILTGVLVALVRFIRGGVGLLLWCVRLGFDRTGTWRGVRSWVLDTAPLAPGRTLASQRAAEALALAEGATLTTKQVQQEAAAERLALEAKAREDRQAAEQLLAQAEQQAARKLAEVQQEAERRVHALTEAAAGDARAQADLLHRRETELAQVTSERDRAVVGAQRTHRAESETREVRAQLDDRRRMFELLCQYAGARAVLRAQYEALRLAGDQRYGDRDAVPDLARVWAPGVGITEQTARRYLLEHITDPAVGANQDGED